MDGPKSFPENKLNRETRIALHYYVVWSTAGFFCKGEFTFNMCPLFGARAYHRLRESKNS